MKKKKKFRTPKIRSYLLIVFVLLVTFLSLSMFLIKQQRLADEKSIKKTNTISCNRGSRIDNLPVYDRALSLINEKYSFWESSDMPDEYRSLYLFFPARLTYCIKVIEGDTRKGENAEGYFEFNSDNIKKDYFPIIVDKSYNKSDDQITALLLVHEIVHVSQYIDEQNGNEELNCISKEAQAFNAALQFYNSSFNDEQKKSVQLKIKHDENLHPQLEILTSILGIFEKDNLYESYLYQKDLCENPSECNKNKEYEIEKFLINNEYYKNECDL